MRSAGFDNKEGNSKSCKKSKVTGYVIVSEKGRSMDVDKGERKKNPLENNWELAMRLKEIIIENDEKWRKFEKEKRIYVGNQNKNKLSVLSI